MEPTKIKPGERTPSLPVPAGPSAPEPYQRAPTLMAGAEAGKQGQVRVWGPSRRKLWITAGMCPIIAAVMYALNIAFPGHTTILGYFCLGYLGATFLNAALALLRPCYVTTDDAGIGITGITTWTESRALRWEEIESAESLPLGEPKITLSLETDDDVEINLTGYPAAIRRELFSLITARCGLRQRPAAKELNVHADVSLALDSSEQAACNNGFHLPANHVRNEDPPVQE